MICKCICISLTSVLNGIATSCHVYTDDRFRDLCQSFRPSRTLDILYIYIYIYLEKNRHSGCRRYGTKNDAKWQKPCKIAKISPKSKGKFALSARIIFWLPSFLKFFPGMMYIYNNLGFVLSLLTQMRGAA